MCHASAAILIVLRSAQKWNSHACSFLEHAREKCRISSIPEQTGALAGFFGEQPVVEHLAIQSIAGDAQPRCSLLDVVATEIQGFCDGLFLHIAQRTARLCLRRCKPTRAALVFG